MLVDLRVGGFKSYGEAQRLPLVPLTVLIGANASGKSNLIEAMQLLAWLARSQRLGNLAHALRDGELLVRGQPQDLPAEGRDIELGARVDDLTLELKIRADRRAPRIIGEKLEDSKSPSTLPLYVVDRPASAHGSELIVAYNNFAKGKNKPHIACIDQQAVFTQLLTPARFDAAHEESQRKIPEACRRVSAALGSIVFLDPAPRAMRDYSYRDETQLDGNGSNVSAVLQRVCESGGHDEVLSFIRTLPEQNIQRIEFLEGPRNDVMVRLVETFGGNERAMDAAVLSDGTLRVLAIAAAVLSVEPGSLVVIEEIDNGVHPARARLLMESLHAAAKRRGVQLLVTTHNPALLDAIPLEAIGDAVACYRDPASGQSRLQRLSDLEDFVALAAEGPLGMLSTSGALEKYLKARPTPEERARQGERALELFRSAGER